ncbi:RHS repeat-associated core domain-containing protein [Marinobacter sp.]|uniref:RHS repeat-associated core domain-containing protein n=1 Tax=Marinobacter sp. TaxID=50741 RepID=UPI00384E119F
MSHTRLVEIVSVTGEGFGFGPSGAEGPGEPVRMSSASEWKAWLLSSFSRRFQEQAQHWEIVLGSAGSRQSASSPRITFRRIAEMMEAGTLEARRLPPHVIPKKVSAADSDPAESMRSQQSGNGPVTSPASGSPDLKGAATDDPGPDPDAMQCKGDPVAPATGEEILSLDDFTVPAPMPLHWRRLYRSRFCDRQFGLGAGWFADVLRIIWQDDEATWLVDHEARPVRLPLLGKGELAWQAVSGQRLERKADDRMMLTESDGRVWIFAPDGLGQWRPVSVQNSLGHQWLFSYDGERRLSRLDLAPDRWLEFGYGKGPELRQIDLLQGEARTTLAFYGHDADGNLTTATTARGTEHYGYLGHLLTSRQLATGYSFLFHWDGHGPEARCVRTHGEDGHFDFRFDYEPDRFLTRVTDAFGQVETFHYDEKSRITAREDADGGVHQWAWDDQGRLAARRLPDGRTTRYGYDARGRQVLEQLPDGREHRRRYNALGFCIAERWPDGRAAARRFDPLGRVLEERRPDGSEWQYQYDSHGWLSEAVSNTGEVRRTGFGTRGELLADEQKGALARYAFDAQGRVKGRLVQDLVTEYDYLGEQISAIHQYPEQAPDQRRSRFYQYDGAGRLTRFTAASGEHHGFDYDGLARPVRYQRPDGHAVHYQYDKAQRLTRVIRPDGQKWSLGYDSKGQINTCQAPDGRRIEFRYDAAGDIIHREQEGDWVQHLKRDAGGRVLQQTSQGRGRSPVSRQFHYDRLGRRAGAACADRRLAWDYDCQGRVTEHRQDQHSIRYGYGPGKQLHSIQLPDGTEIQYIHDRQGRWQGVTVNGQTVLQRSFDEQGREQSRQAGEHNRQTEVWDRHDCLINRRWQGTQSAVRRYTWDAESRLEELTDSLEGARTFKRDPQGQLIADNEQTFDYDHGGNRKPADATLQQDRLLKTGTAIRKYDALGAETEVRAGYTEHRRFDAEGQLTEVRRDGLHVRYGYDALGRRAWRKSENGTTTYLWHNDVLLGEQPPNGQWQWYIRDPETDGSLFTLINGTPYHYELDWRGMPIRLWAEDGSLAWQANADAWGKCQPEGEVHQPIRLPGQFEDELTGLYNNRFRDYDPETGRYLTPDPLGVKGGLNTYRYTRNPVDYVDPLGLENEPVVTAANANLGEEAAVPDNVPPVSEVSAVDYAVGATELVVKGAWNGLVEVTAGLGGLGTLLFTRDGAAGAGVVDGIQEQYTWAPTTEGAEAIGEAVAPVFEKYEAGKERLGEVGTERGSPSLATALYTAPDAAMAVAGGFLGRGVINSGRSKSSNTNSTARDRIQGNIEQSRAARESSGFSAQSHREKALKIELKGRHEALSNAEVRTWYNEMVAPIPELDKQWIRHGMGPEARARNAHGIRHDARVKARTLMEDPAEVEMLRARDMEVYQNPDGPTFDYLVEKNRSKGISGDDIYEEIVGSSNRTSKEYNEKFK